MCDDNEKKVMEEELEELRRHLERRVAQKTEQLERRITCLEACNAALCDKLEQYAHCPHELKYDAMAASL